MEIHEKSLLIMGYINPYIPNFWLMDEFIPPKILEMIRVLDPIAHEMP